MKRVSNAYKLAMAKRIRDHAYMVVSVGVISNEAQNSAKIISDMNYLSNNRSLFRNEETTKYYATFEENVSKVDGSMYFPPENTEYIQILNGVCALSEDILGSISFQFDNGYDIKGLTIDFGKYYPNSVQIIINDTDAYTYTNNSNQLITTDNYDRASTITIKPLAFNNGDNKRLRIESIKMGVGLSFDNHNIKTATLTDATSFVSEELPQLDFTVTCFDKNKWFNVDDDNTFINYLMTGQELNVTIGMELADESVEWVQMPPTYLSDWASDTNTVSFSSADKFAVYLNEKYEDGNYIHSRTLYNEAEIILTAAGLEADEYFIDDVLKNITIINPMPTVSYAQCLQLIANAGRCALKQDSQGRITLTPNFENIVEPTDLVITTDSQADWSKPDNIRTGSSIIYADFTQDFVPVDGSFYFLPESGENYLETGFVSSSIADDYGSFGSIVPSLEITLPATYTYYGMDFMFGGNPPTEFTVSTYDSGALIDSVTVKNPTNEYYLYHEFYGFDSLVLTFDKGTPNNRVVLQKVKFADLTDYRLLKQDMLSNPVGVVEPKTKSVSVKIFTYEEDEKGKAKKVDDDNFYTVDLNPIGEVITFENQLISTKEHAQQIAEWLGNYYANNVTYTVNYRGEPRIDSADYIFMDSDAINNLQVEVESHTLNFNGALSGTLELRRATNMIS